MNDQLKERIEKAEILIQEEIDQLLDVDAVSINASESLLNIVYDASKRQLDEIEEIVRKYE